MKDRITVLIKEPCKESELKTIDNTLEAMQAIVGGYIETVNLPGGGILVCNEEGFIKGLKPNCLVCGHKIYYGTFFLCGADPEDPENFGDAPITWVNSFTVAELWAQG